MVKGKNGVKVKPPHHALQDHRNDDVPIDSAMARMWKKMAGVCAATMGMSGCAANHPSEEIDARVMQTRTWKTLSRANASLVIVQEGKCGETSTDVVAIYEDLPTHMHRCATMKLARGADNRIWREEMDERGDLAWIQEWPEPAR